MIDGYARVSTDTQDLTSQLAQLKAVGCTRIFRVMPKDKGDDAAIKPQDSRARPPPKRGFAR